VAAFATISSIDVALTDQYTEKLTKEGSQSGIILAQACLDANSGTPQWTNAKPLKPNTDCSGNEVVACNNTSTDARCFVMKDGNYRVKFEVTFDTDTGGKLTSINSRGIADQVRTTSGDTFSRDDTTLKASPGGSTSPSVIISGSLSLAAMSVGAYNTQNYVSSAGHACAIADAQLYCWGYNAGGQLGDGTTTDRSVPTLVSALAGKTVTSVKTASFLREAYGGNLSADKQGSTCAIADAQLYCWGSGGYPGSGSGATPTLVSQLSGKKVTSIEIAAMSVGAYNTQNYVSSAGHACAIADAQLYCWGYNAGGQLGDGTTTDRSVPTLVSALAGKTVTSVKTASFLREAYGGNLSADKQGSTCAIADAQLYCWGSGGYPGSGSGATPTITGTNGSALPSGAPLSITNGSLHTCAIGSDSKAYCWGYNAYGQLGNNSTTNSNVPVAVMQGAIPAGVTIKSISAGDRQNCVIGSDDKAYCWGANNFYQLGNGSGTTSYTPVAVSQGAMPSTSVKAISVGAHHSCVVGSNDMGYCWGANDQGYLGNGSITNASVPTAVSQGAIPAGVTLKSISAGQFHTCAIGSNNKAYCWGYNIYGQLGNSSTTDSTTPVAVAQGAMPAGVTFKSIAAGQYHTCAIGSDDKAYCWGYGSSGQVGNGTTSNSSSPAAVSQGAMSSTSVKQITAGGTHSCAIGSDNKVYCWGYGASGQLGNNGTASSSSPVAASTSTSFNSIVVEGSHSCAIGSDSKAYCWGYNYYGRLGDKTTTQRNTPTTVLQSPVWGGSGALGNSLGSSLIFY